MRENGAFICVILNFHAGSCRKLFLVSALVLTKAVPRGVRLKQKAGGGKTIRPTRKRVGFPIFNGVFGGT